MSLRRRRSKVWGAALAALFALTLLGGCGQEAAPAQKAPMVKTQQAGKASLSEESYSGTVKGRYETNLSFQVGGQILSSMPVMLCRRPTRGMPRSVRPGPS